MGAISRIETTIKRAGHIAEKKIRNQLKIVRPGNSKRMSTTHQLSKSLKSEFVDAGGGRMTLVVTTPHRYGKILDDGFNALKVFPFLNVIKYSFPSLKILNSNFSDKALTTETPTPCNPPDTLYES